MVLILHSKPRIVKARWNNEALESDEINFLDRLSLFVYRDHRQRGDGGLGSWQMPGGRKWNWCKIESPPSGICGRGIAAIRPIDTEHCLMMVLAKGSSQDHQEGGSEARQSLPNTLLVYSVYRLRIHTRRH